MRVVSVRNISKSQPVQVMDCCVEGGYLKKSRGSLPDVDLDFAADKRDAVKAHLEQKYDKPGSQRVFAAGTFTTAKIRSSIKDVARTYKIPVGTVEYLTKIIDDGASWTDVMRLAASDKRVRNFINKYPQVFEDILPIMGQARSAGIHASAFIIVPEHVKGEKVDCFDLLPIRKMDGQLVSEISGYDIDEIGILKNDVLAIQELTRIADMFTLINEQYHVKYTLLQIASQYLNDPKIFELLRAGNTQGVFQLSADGMTRFIKRMKPDNIHDLIAAVALFRPGPLDSGVTQAYIDCKNGTMEPEYLWGMYDITKETYGQLVYQEQVSKIAQKIGGLSLGDGVNLVKALSKKKIEKVRKFKEKYFDGAKKNGCPKEAAERVWEIVEAGAKYLFNASHATAYGLTAYVGAWLKTYYPTPFYTVVLRDHDEDKLPILLSEIKASGKTEVVKPNINLSGTNFIADYKHNCIYWSLSRVKWVGPKAVSAIEKERKLFGDFVDLEDFIKRIFRGKFEKVVVDGTEEVENVRNQVNTRHVKNLIVAGAFDDLEGIDDIRQRHALLIKATEMLGFYLNEKDFPADLLDKQYFWARKQVEISGFGAVDYKGLVDSSRLSESAKKSNHFIQFKELENVFCTYKKCIVSATITKIEEKHYNDKGTGERKRYAKISLQQNIETAMLIMWGDVWEEVRKNFMKSEGRILVCVANIKWSDYDEKFNLQLGKTSFYQLI